MWGSMAVGGSPAVLAGKEHTDSKCKIIDFKTSVDLVAGSRNIFLE